VPYFRAKVARRSNPAPVCALLCALAASCASPSPPRAPAPVLARPSNDGSAGAPLPLEEGPWGTFRSRRFELALRLPDGARWKIDDHRTAWLKAEHAPTQSALWLRSWPVTATVTRQGCYAQSREWLPALPDLDGARFIDDRVRPLFASLDTRTSVFVEPVVAAPEGAAGTRGYVVAAGAGPHRCVVLVFVTRASGAGAEDEVGTRLALVSERLLPTVQLDQSFAPSREPVRPSLPRAPGAAR
jgi:hypothetical protein